MIGKGLMWKAKGSGLGPPPSEKACIDKGQTETKPYLLQLYRFWKPDRESKEWNKDHALLRPVVRCGAALRASLEPPRCAMGLWHKRGPDQGRFLARHQWEWPQTVFRHPTMGWNPFFISSFISNLYSATDKIGEGSGPLPFPILMVQALGLK